jgi:hypothetical protein
MTSPVRVPRPTPRRTPIPRPASERRAHLRVVAPSSRPEPQRRHVGAAVLVLAVCLVFGSLLTSAILHGLLASGQTTIDRLDAELQRERTELANEKLTLANLQSPERIAREAARIGMVPAERQHWVSAAGGDEAIVTRTTEDLPDTDGDLQPGSELAGGREGTATE